MDKDVTLFYMPLGESTVVPPDVQGKAVPDAAVAKITISRRTDSEPTTTTPTKLLSEIKTAAEATKIPNGHQLDWKSLSPASQAKLDYTSPKYDPNYDLYRAVVDEALQGNSLLENGGTQKIADKMVLDLQQAGVDTSDPNISIRKLGEMYLTKRYNQVGVSEPTQISRPTEKPRHLLTKWRKGSGKENQPAPSSGITMESEGSGNAAINKNPDRVITSHDEWLKTLPHMSSQDIARNPNAPPAPTSADYADLRMRRPNIQEQKPDPLASPRALAERGDIDAALPLYETIAIQDQARAQAVAEEVKKILEKHPDNEAAKRLLANIEEDSQRDGDTEEIRARVSTQAPTSEDYRTNIQFRRPDVVEQPPPEPQFVEEDDTPSPFPTTNTEGLPTGEVSLKYVAATSEPERPETAAEALASSDSNTNQTEDPGTGTAATDRIDREKAAQFVRPTLIGKPLQESPAEPFVETPIPETVLPQTPTPTAEQSKPETPTDPYTEILKGARGWVQKGDLSSASTVYQMVLITNPEAGETIFREMEDLYLKNKNNPDVQKAFANVLYKINKAEKGKEVMKGNYKPEA